MTNAMANRAMGAGTENEEYYKCERAFMNIDNIHVMRDSLNKFLEGMRRNVIWIHIVNVFFFSVYV